MLRVPAFAVATCIKPEILLMDEMIEAGDANFKKKAEIRLTEFIEQSSIMVLASHSNETIKRFFALDSRENCVLPAEPDR